jgi:hypothetical protein
MQRFNRAVALCGSLLLGSCALVKVDPPEARLNGIATIVESAGDVDVIMIHGMAYHDKNWARTTNAALAQATGGIFDSSTFDNSSGTPLGDKGATLFAGSIAFGQSTIHTHAIVWSPISVPFKQTLCYDVSEADPPVCSVGNGERRAWLNGFIKSALLDARLADVVFYVGDEWSGQQYIRKAVDEAVRLVLTQAQPATTESERIEAMQDRSRPIIIMTESLGSKILWDSVNDLACHASANERKAFVDALGSVETVFMAANQIPILSPTEPMAPRSDCADSKRSTSTSASHPLSGLLGFAELVNEGKQHRGLDTEAL